MNTERELHNYLELKGIYLPKYGIEKAFQMLKSNPDIFSAVYEVEAAFDKPKYKTPEAKKKAHYSPQRDISAEYRDKSCRAIEQINIKTGEVITHKSIYSAAKALGKDKGFGNISNSANGKTSSAYGFKWKFKGE